MTELVNALPGKVRSKSLVRRSRTPMNDPMAISRQELFKKNITQVHKPWLMYMTLTYFGVLLLFLSIAIFASTGIPYAQDLSRELGVSDTYFALEPPPDYWFFSIGGLLMLTMLTNAILMVVAMLVEEPGAFLLNAAITFVAIVVFHAAPQFIDKNCFTSVDQCPGSAIYFVWREI